MTSEIDIYRSAHTLIEQHGEGAAVQAAMEADAMLDKGDLDGAITHFRNAIRIDAQQTAIAANSLAVILITHPDPAKRNGPEAVQLALRVHASLQAQGQASPQVLTTLADAYALCGQWEMASQTIAEAIRLAQSMGQVEFSQQLQGRLQQYQRMQ